MWHVLKYDCAARPETFGQVQVLLRWEVQRGVSTAFKAVKPEHIQSNLEALNFELPPDDMRALTTIAYTVSSRHPIVALHSKARHPALS